MELPRHGEHESRTGGTGPYVVNEPMGTQIDLDDVTERYQVGDVAVTALDGVHVHVDEASFVVVLRRSGSGKAGASAPRE